MPGLTEVVSWFRENYEPLTDRDVSSPAILVPPALYLILGLIVAAAVS